jgi:hypothetical protein
MKNWLLQEIDGIKIPLSDDFTTDYFGFIYKITNLETGKFYIGKKSFIHNKKKKLGKKELLLIPVTRGRRPTTKREKVDSGWRTYWGSSKTLLSDIKELGEDKFERVILSFHTSSKQLTYFEMMHHVRENVLFRDDCYNDNILAKFYKKDFE